jgi:hypothetical protein
MTQTARTEVKHQTNCTVECTIRIPTGCIITTCAPTASGANIAEPTTAGAFLSTRTLSSCLPPMSCIAVLRMHRAHHWQQRFIIRLLNLPQSGCWAASSIACCRATTPAAPPSLCAEAILLVAPAQQTLHLSAQLTSTALGSAAPCLRPLLPQ